MDEVPNSTREFILIRPTLAMHSGSLVLRHSDSDGDDEVCPEKEVLGWNEVGETH